MTALTTWGAVLGAIFIVVANVVVDVLYAAVDPRVRLH